MKHVKYQAPAITDQVTMELEAEILGSSNMGVDQNIKSVETMGQDVGGTVAADQWTQNWQ